MPKTQQIDTPIDTPVARCIGCRRLMQTAPGCTHNKVEFRPISQNKRIGGEIFDRLSKSLSGKLTADKRCHECGALSGNLHHLDCKEEVCPVCHKRALGCRCTRTHTVFPFKMKEKAPNLKRAGRPAIMLPCHKCKAILSARQRLGHKC